MADENQRKQKFGMLKEPPTSLADALKQILLDPNLLAIYACTFVLALVVPIAISVAVRKWNRAKLERKRRRDGKNVYRADEEEEDEQDASMELPNGMVGSFNKSILSCIRQSKKEFESSPFIPRKNLTLSEEVEDEEEQEKSTKVGIGPKKGDEEEEDGDEERMPELEEATESSRGSENGGGGGEKRKTRKKYKDPDPETAEALNKLIEKGLHGKLATAQLRAKTHVLEERMSEEERQREADIRQEQLAKIFSMMEGQKEKFGISGKEELVEQMKLYNL